ncbi:MAG: LysR substrate-binding domain-containing protein, partial [Rhodospirillales bacterium]
MAPRPLPLTALATFREAAARGSFRGAAVALGTTPSAVSHQIRKLEAALGGPLFTRGVRNVALTQSGTVLAGHVARAFAALEAAVEEAREAGAETRLRVSALPLFTSAWLIPRLARFERAHPGVFIDIETTNRLADLERDNIDVAIRNVDAVTPGLAGRKLLDLRAVPLCAAALAPLLDRPEALADATLIHVSARPDAWSTWLAAAGLNDFVVRRGLAFDTVPAALQAAARGHGVALGIAPLVWDALPAGLVVPFAPPAISAGAYFAVFRRADRARTLVRAFVDWLSAEMNAYPGRANTSVPPAFAAFQQRP